MGQHVTSCQANSVSHAADVAVAQAFAEGGGSGQCLVPTAISFVHTRTFRVAALLTAVVAMSAADLHMTLTHLLGAGMGEGNPIARWVMSANCVWALGLFKLGLVGISTLILWKVRARFSAELAAWLCCGVMVWLTMQWKAYGEALPALTPVIHRMATIDDESSDWVKFHVD